MLGRPVFLTIEYEVGKVIRKAKLKTLKDALS